MNAPLRRLSLVVAALFAALLVSTTWIQFVQAKTLDSKQGNTRSLLASYGRERGPILVGGSPVASSTPSKDIYKFQRTYSAGPLYAPVTGYYSLRYGTAGIERASDGALSGTSDQLFYRRIGDLLTGQQAKGASVELTIDPKVQQVAAQALGTRRGAVVALDPKTGNVLAMVSSPSYDPNLLASHDLTAVTNAWKQLNADPTMPLANRAIAGNLYPPGSVFKLVTAAAALSSGKYNENTMVPGPAQLDLPQTTVKLPNFEPGPCAPGGQLTLTDALKVSCNTAFGGIGLALGGTALHDQAAKFGFGQSLRIPLPVTPSTVPANLNPPQTAQAAIGQFDVRVTPLQMAMVAAAIGNRGLLMKPNLVAMVRAADLQVVDAPQPEQLGQAVTPDVAAALTRMMQQVVLSGTGTAAQIPGVSVAGKTGTAEHGQNAPPHAWFASFAPAQDPKVAVAVVVEDGGGVGGDQATGGRLAAPIAKAVIEAVLNR